jgi:hypothetical protein
MDHDTDTTIEIAASGLKQLGLLLLGVLMTLCGVVLALSARPATAGLDVVIGGLAAVFFGACTLMIAWRFLTMRGPIVTLSPKGLIDTRVSASLIPWTAIEDIGTFTVNRQKFIVVSVDPGVERTLDLTAIARWSRGPNRSLGADGLCISAQGLKVNHATLLDMCHAYLQASRQRAAG